MSAWPSYGCSVHQQQIRDALDRPGLRQRRWLSPVLQTFVLALPRAYASVSASPGTRVRLVIDGAAGGVWTLTRSPSRWHLSVGSGEPVEAEVRLPEEMAWRLMARLISVREGRRFVESSGPRYLVEPATRALAIMTSIE